MKRIILATVSAAALAMAADNTAFVTQASNGNMSTINQGGTVNQ